MRGLAADLADRHGEFVRSGGGGGNPVRGLFHRGGDTRGLQRRLFGRRGHRPGSFLQLRGGRRNAVDHFADRGFESLGELNHFLAAFAAEGVPFLRHSLDLPGGLEEDLERARQIADLVAAAGRGNVDVLLAPGEARGDVGHPPQRARHVAANEARARPCDAEREGRDREEGDEEPHHHGPRLRVGGRADVLDLAARGTCQVDEILAFAIDAVGKCLPLGLSAARQLRRLDPAA